MLNGFDLLEGEKAVLVRDHLIPGGLAEISSGFEEMKSGKSYLQKSI